MGWYAASGLWRRRAAISVEIAAATPIDVNITIPPEWDAFWSAIDSSGNNLRVIWYDGKTVLTYAIDNGSGGAFDKTNRLGRIQIDGMTVPNATGMLCIWLYFDPSSNQSSGASAVTISSAQNGYIELGTPGQHRFRHQPQTPRATKPRSIVHKTVNEQAFVWIRHSLSRRATPGNSSSVHEEPLYCTQQVVNSSAVDQAAMYDVTKARWVWTPRGELWLRVLIKAGTTATNYTLVVLTRTILPNETTATQQLETRIGVAVRDNLES